MTTKVCPGCNDDDLDLLLFSDTLSVLARMIGKEVFSPLAAECIQLGLNLTDTIDDPDLRRCTYVFFFLPLLLSHTKRRMHKINKIHSLVWLELQKPKIRGNSFRAESVFLRVSSLFTIRYGLYSAVSTVSPESLIPHLTAVTTVMQLALKSNEGITVQSVPTHMSTHPSVFSELQSTMKTDF